MPENPRCWLILGPWHSRYGDPAAPASEATDRGVHRLVDVDAAGGRATRVLRWEQLRHSRSVHLTGNGRVVAAEETVTYTDLTVRVHGTRALPDAMPLALLAPDNDGWQIYLPIRLGADDCLFHQVDTLPATTRHRYPPPPTVLAQTLHRLPAYSETAGSHECWYFTQDPDIEYEHKFTLPTDTDIYALARDIKNEIGRGELSDYRAEFRNDFELWQFANHMFDITGPNPADHGYASFIPRLNGGYTLKRKQFQHDGFARTEHKTDCPPGIATLTDMADHLTGTLGLDARYIGSFDRIRFDVMIENSATGHIHSLMTDRCLVSHTRAVLQQLEIEYIHTRGNTRECRAEIISELDHLKNWTARYLTHRGIPATADYTSKHTFLHATA
ncbi:hypothetical protein [Nocardia wallacei]|uniref:hypothetical protein n=1 Tax=Nocardia wallacei TaxID=480035 RepID=UPI002455E826|nr:hypothetical protein [Nocardia wallacei]